MSDRPACAGRLTAEPGTLEFLRQLLEIAQESDHPSTSSGHRPMDKALARVLSKQIGEIEAVRSSSQAEGSDGA